MPKRKKKSSRSPLITHFQDRGAAKIIGVSIAAVLLLFAGVFGYLALTQKSEPQLVADSVQVTADDLLTTGDSNAELTTDYKIIAAGLKRDGEQRDVAKAVLDDEALPVGTGVTPDTTVEQSRLSQLQTEFIKEVDRRLAEMKEASALLDKLTSEQKTASLKYIADETTALTGLKAKAAAETAQDALLKDRDELDKEYDSYRMVIFQVYVLLWANDQRILVEKANVMGGKLQERLNDASNHGVSIASMQTLLNGYQTNKEAAKTQNDTSLKALMTTKPGTFEANKAVLQKHLNVLSGVHDEIQKTSDASKEIIVGLPKN